MKRIIAMFTLVSVLFGSFSARADFFGGDIPILLQILQQAIQELIVLRQTLEVAKGQSDLLERVNRDIDSALSEIHAIQDTIRDTNDIGKTKDPVELLVRLRGIYGRIPRIGNNAAMIFADTVSGSAFGVDNDSHTHARMVDDAALRLQGQARFASPGRAQQLTAQSQTAILHSLAQIERNGGTSARIAATQLAIKNTEEKNQIESFDRGYSDMATSKASDKPDFTLGSL